MVLTIDPERESFQEIVPKGGGKRGEGIEIERAWGNVELVPKGHGFFERSS